MATNDGRQAAEAAAIKYKTLFFKEKAHFYLNVTFSPTVALLWCWCFVAWKLCEGEKKQSKLICVPCDVCGPSGVQQATLLLVELSRLFPLFLFSCQGMLNVAMLLDLVSLFTTPGARVTPLPASYGKILTQLSLEIRLVASFEVQKFTLKYVDQVVLQNKIFVTQRSQLACKSDKLHQSNNTTTRWLFLLFNGTCPVFTYSFNIFIFVTLYFPCYFL